MLTVCISAILCKFKTVIPPPIWQGYIKVQIGSGHDSVIGSVALSNIPSSVLPPLPLLYLNCNFMKISLLSCGGEKVGNQIGSNVIQFAERGNESIMLRNVFGRTECTPWLRGSFCLSGPSCLCILQRANQEPQSPLLYSRHLLLRCSPRSTSENVLSACILKCNRSVWMVFPLTPGLYYLCVMYSLNIAEQTCWFQFVFPLGRINLQATFVHLDPKMPRTIACTQYVLQMKLYNGRELSVDVERVIH